MEGWKRTYAAVFVADVVTAVGMMSFLPFFPSYLAELGVEGNAVALWAGLVFGAAPLVAALMAPFWGTLGDRYGRRAMVQRALIAIALFVGLMGLVQSPWQLLALRIGQGLFSGFVAPSVTLVSVAAPREMQSRVAGTLQASLGFGGIVGPLIGAWLASAFGMRWVFLFVSLAAATAALIVFAFARESDANRASGGEASFLGVWRATLEDLRALLSERAVRAALLVLFIVQFGLRSVSPVMELVVGEVTPGDADDVRLRTSWLFTGVSVLYLATTPLWGRYADRIGPARVLFRSAVLSALVLLALSFVRGYPALLLLYSCIGLTGAGANTAAFGAVGSGTPVERRGNAFGAMFSARALAIALGATTGGALAALVGLRGLFLVAGIGILGALAALRPVGAQGTPTLNVSR